MNLRSRILAGTLTSLSMTSIAEGGQPIFNPDNGHYYELVADAVLWTDAKAAADASVYRGKYGHLATITSESENDFIVNNVIAEPDQVISAYCFTLKA